MVAPALTMAQTLTVRHLADHLRLATGAEPRGLSALEVINAAGAWLSGIHAWAYYENHRVPLHLRGDFSYASATWTQATKNIFRNQGFADWEPFDGDKVISTAGTGLLLTTANVVSKIDPSNITIDVDLGPDAVDLAFTLQIGDTGVMHVPDGLEEIQGVDATEGNSSGLVDFVTKQELAKLRAAQPVVTTPGKYYIAQFWHGGPPRKRWLEVWPEPVELANDYFQAYGRGTWVDLTDDESLINLPPYLRPLMIEAARCFARGYQQPETDPLGSSLQDLLDGPVFAAALRADSGFLPSLGVLGPGAARRPYVANPLSGPVGDPVSP